MRSNRHPNQAERISQAYRRLANAMILSTLREISRSGERLEVEAPEVEFVESRRMDAWCELAGLEPDVVRRTARSL